MHKVIGWSYEIPSYKMNDKTVTVTVQFYQLFLKNLREIASFYVSHYRTNCHNKMSLQNVTTDCCNTLLEKIKAKKIDIFDTFIYFPHGKYICSVNVL